MIEPRDEQTIEDRAEQRAETAIAESYDPGPDGLWLQRLAAEHDERVALRRAHAGGAS